MSRDNRLQKRINEAYAKGYAAGLEETVHLSEQFGGSVPGGNTGDTISGSGAIDFNDYTFILSLISNIGNTYQDLLDYTAQGPNFIYGQLRLPSGVRINILPGSPFIVLSRSNPPQFTINFNAIGEYFGVQDPYEPPPGTPGIPRDPVPQIIRPGTKVSRPTRQAPRPGIQQGPGGGFGGGMQPPM
jgi:hypothetical protein